MHAAKPSTSHRSRPRAQASTHVLRELDQPRTDCERDLERVGRPLPLESRVVWARYNQNTGWLVAARDAFGTCQSALTFDVQRSRALPGHLLLRASRVGPGLDPQFAMATFAEAVALARREQRVLRLSIELFEPDEARRSEYGAMLAALGFVPAAKARSYRDTLLLDLRPDEATIFAGLHKTARQNVRELDKRPLRIAAVDDPKYIARLQALEHETMSRTGGEYAAENWEAALALSAASPQLSRISGLFRTDRDDEQALIGFAWGVCHGTYAQYRAGGSTRVNDIRVSVGYPLLWDIARWAKASGAEWFDLGGVTNTTIEEDKVGGISDFKRRFSPDAIRVGEEWEFEPRPFRARVAQALSRASARLKQRLAGSAS